MELKTSNKIRIIVMMTSLVLLFFGSCKHLDENEKVTFDATLWKEKDIRGQFIFRDEMLDDLVYNVQLKGLSKKEVIAKLGEPDWVIKEYMYYEAPPKNTGFFPFQKRYLVLKLKKDNTVEWRKIKN